MSELLQEVQPPASPPEEKKGNRENRTRWLVVCLLWLAHGILYTLFSLNLTGAARPFDPLELFNVILLLGNIFAGVVILAGKRDIILGGGVMFLVATHAFIGHRLAPDALTSGAILLVNILTIYVGITIYRRLPSRHWIAYVVSYFVLFAIFIKSPIPQLPAMSNAEALFLLFLMGLAACARSMRMLAYFWALTLSFTFCQPYAWESLIISFMILTVMFGAKGALRSHITLVFLGVGLALVLFVLLPIIMLIVNQDLHNLWKVLGDPRIRGAIFTTVLTATLSTIFLVIFAVPFAYALSRLRFPGRTLLLSLIDVPIVVPQSAAGIALAAVFASQQPLGQTLFYLFGVRFDGTMLGVCLAQVFVAMPFITKASLAAFDAVPQNLEIAGRTLGANPRETFWRIALPLAGRGVFLGAVLAWARAAGEFGALYFIARTPETAPVSVYNKFQSVGVAETGPLVATLLIFSVVMFFLLQFASRSLPVMHDAERRA